MLPIERALRGFVADGSGLPRGRVIPGNDPAPAPLEPYASLLLISDRRLAHPVTADHPDDSGRVLSLSYRRSEWSVQWYRRDADAMALEFAIWAESDLGLIEAERIGVRLVWPASSGIRRLDTIVGDGFEGRAGLDLRVDWCHATEQRVGAIDTARVDLCTGETERSLDA